jgi:hypothetical protein
VQTTHPAPKIRKCSQCGNKGKHLADPMDGGRSPAMPAGADQEEQCALTVDARRLVPCER